MGWKGSKPDTSKQEALAQTQSNLALEQAQIAREERAFQREEAERWRPLFEGQINASIASQQKADQRSEDQWAVYQKNFLPAESRLSEAALNYDTPERRGLAAAEAVAGVDTQFQRVNDARTRDLGRAGISLDSGRALTLDAASRLGQAKAAAGADRTARQQIENTGLSLIDNVAKMGRGVAGTSLQAQGVGLNAGQVATGQIGAQQNTYNASMDPAMRGYSGAAQGLGSASNMYGNIAQQQAQASNATMNGLLGIAKLGTSIYMAKSDPRTKTVHGKVSGKRSLADIEKKPVYDWTYKDGHGDGGRHVGRMAGDGDPKIGGMHHIDMISELGKTQSALAELSKEVKGLKGKKRSLADAEDVDSREVA